MASAPASWARPRSSRARRLLPSPASPDTTTASPTEDSWTRLHASQGGDLVLSAHKGDQIVFTCGSVCRSKGKGSLACCQTLQVSLKTHHGLVPVIRVLRQQFGNHLTECLREVRFELAQRWGRRLSMQN